MMKVREFVLAGLVFAGLVMTAAIHGAVAEPGTDQAGAPQEEQKQYLYKWTDSKGVVHISDDLNKVPKQYRQNARRLESQAGEEEKPGASSPRVQKAPPVYDDAQEREADLKEEWQQRIRSAKQRLADAERRYQEIKKKRDEAVMSWGGPASGRLEGREEAAKLEEEMNQVQREVEAARTEIEITIPNDARKKGIPPGWLRE
ncbi:MAG TPA: DUF4124 domain-containing protein, partial [Nitrospirota bacterium]|nr:DUF4124 domain-containing protein [Nitrospirota bacterium]